MLFAVWRFIYTLRLPQKGAFGRQYCCGGAHGLCVCVADDFRGKFLKQQFHLKELKLCFQYFVIATKVLCRLRVPHKPLVREIVKDMEDVEGDEAYKINTLAVQYGLTTAKVSAIIVLLLLLAGLAILMKGFSAAHAWKEFIYLGPNGCSHCLVLACILILRKWQKQKLNYGRASMLLKIIMLLGIFSIPAFYLFNK